MSSNLADIFPTDPIPPGPSIVMPFEADSDRACLMALLTGRRWTSVSYSYLRQKYPGPLEETFFYLTDTGKTYFLPAFLQMCEEKPEEVDVLPDSMLYYFSKIEPDAPILNMLSPTQKEYVMQFFEVRYAQAPSYSKKLARARSLLKTKS